MRIIGAQKSGTTSLRAFMENNSEYFFISNREPHFWNRDLEYRDGEGIPEYLSKFVDANKNQLIGEKSPSYLPSALAAERIAKHLPDVKIIALIRNPSERAYSGYLHGRRLGLIPSERSFLEAIKNYMTLKSAPFGDVISQGFYSTHLKPYFNHFPREQILVMEFEKMITAPRQTLEGLIEFLFPENLDVKNQINFELPHRNIARKSIAPKFVKWIRGQKRLSAHRKNKLSKLTFKSIKEKRISEEEIALLNKTYRESIYDLEKLLDRKLEW